MIELMVATKEIFHTIFYRRLIRSLALHIGVHAILIFLSVRLLPFDHYHPQISLRLKPRFVSKSFDVGNAIRLHFFRYILSKCSCTNKRLVCIFMDTYRKKGHLVSLTTWLWRYKHDPGVWKVIISNIKELNSGKNDRTARRKKENDVIPITEIK